MMRKKKNLTKKFKLYKDRESQHDDDFSEEKSKIYLIITKI